MKAKNIIGKIYVSQMPIWGVLKHFVEDFKLQFLALSDYKQLAAAAG